MKRLHFPVEDAVAKLIEEAAEADHRSVANFLAVIVLTEMKRRAESDLRALEKLGQSA